MLIGAQTGFDVADRNLAVERGQRGGHRRRGVALHQHGGRPLGVEHGAQAGERASA